MRLSGNAVLLVIDCQNGFISDHSRGIIPTVSRLIKEWQSRDLPVIATKFINEPGSPYERLINWTRCQGSPDTDIVEGLQEHVDDGMLVVEKPGYTFFTREWADRAIAEGWSDVVMVGIDTDGCVLKSALDAFELDLTPWIVTDGTASHSGQRAYDAALYIAGRTVGRGQLVDVQEVLAGLP